MCWRYVPVESFSSLHICTLHLVLVFTGLTLFLIRGTQANTVLLAFSLQAVGYEANGVSVLFWLLAIVVVSESVCCPITCLCTESDSSSECKGEVQRPLHTCESRFQIRVLKDGFFPQTSFFLSSHSNGSYNSLLTHYSLLLETGAHYKRPLSFLVSLARSVCLTP